ncbi:MAG TPA: hypothetical protein VGM26_13520 [Rhizomicrobium sp.]|jgi:hypothetical protein
MTGQRDPICACFFLKGDVESVLKVTINTVADNASNAYVYDIISFAGLTNAGMQWLRST